MEIDQRRNSRSGRCLRFLKRLMLPLTDLMLPLTDVAECLAGCGVIYHIIPVWQIEFVADIPVRV